MCHHTLGTDPEALRNERPNDEDDEEPVESTPDPEFANEDATVDVELLDADD